MVADRIASYILLVAFGCLLLFNVYLIEFRRRITTQKQEENPLPTNHNHQHYLHPLAARTTTGGLAGFLAGLFGVGGGVIMVPMQILLLHEKIQTAIQTSLGSIVIIALSACAGHLWAGNVLWLPGLLLGIGGVLGVQASARFLPNLPARFVSLAFRTLLVTLATYIFWQAWQDWQAYAMI
jgi:uncharacterized membrane protein YfcA